MIPVAMNSAEDVVQLKNGTDSVKIHLHGATVISWCVDGKELLFLSSKALLDGSKPIRGGIPLVFPQFGTGPIMSGQHGFARTLKWDALAEGRTESSCKFQLKHSETTLKLWPHKFTLNYTVSLQKDGLKVKFEVLNCDEFDFDFTALLHTYFNISSIDSVKIEGLSQLEYADKLKNNQKFHEDRVVIENINEEVDRNYFNVPGKVNLLSSNANFEISSNFKDLVVWNPWIEKSKAMADFDDEEYKKMICLEFGHVEKAFNLKSGDKFDREQSVGIYLPGLVDPKPKVPLRMYNGIGLRTARGTGTNGYVQKNLSFIKPKQQNSKFNSNTGSTLTAYDEGAKAKPTKKPNEEILLHNNRRKVENELLEYREELESSKKYTPEEIDEKVKIKREKLLKDLETRLESSKEEVLMEVKEREMLKMKEAFGIKKGAEEGRAFNFESEKQRQERQERMTQEEKSRRYRPY